MPHGIMYPLLHVSEFNLQLFVVLKECNKLVVVAGTPTINVLMIAVRVVPKITEASHLTRFCDNTKP